MLYLNTQIRKSYDISFFPAQCSGTWGKVFWGEELSSTHAYVQLNFKKFVSGHRLRACDSVLSQTVATSKQFCSRKFPQKVCVKPLYAFRSLPYGVARRDRLSRTITSNRHLNDKSIFETVLYGHNYRNLAVIQHDYRKKR